MTEERLAEVILAARSTPRKDRTPYQEAIIRLARQVMMLRKWVNRIEEDL
jgi:hypothetical protein